MALNTVEEIEALADGLTDAAGALHRRILREIKAGKIDQPTAQGLFRQESSLRQKADSLYADAASAVVSGLEILQADLMGLIQAAKEKIETVENLQQGMEVFGDVIVLAVSITAHKPGPIVAAIKEIRDDLKQG